MLNTGINGRFKFVRFTACLVSDCLLTGTINSACKVIEGLPDGARIVYADWKQHGLTPSSGEIRLVIHHDSFDLIENGDELPELVLSFERVYKESEPKPVKFREFF